MCVVRANTRSALRSTRLVAHISTRSALRSAGLTTAQRCLASPVMHPRVVFLAISGIHICSDLHGTRCRVVRGVVADVGPHVVVSSCVALVEVLVNLVDRLMLALPGDVHPRRCAHHHLVRAVLD